MRPREQQRLVALLRHLPSRVVDALVGATVISERYRVADAGHGEHDHREPGSEIHTFDIELDGRLEAVSRGSDLMEGLFTDLLPDELPVRFDADDNAAASAVRKGAEGLQRFTQLTRRAFELEGPRFAPGDELVEAGDHGGVGTYNPRPKWQPHPRQSGPAIGLWRVKVR